MAENIELKNNLMSFRETFREYTDFYTVIGGTACMILMEEASRDFRATKDVDMGYDSIYSRMAAQQLISQNWTI